MTWENWACNCECLFFFRFIVLDSSSVSFKICKFLDSKIFLFLFNNKMSEVAPVAKVDKIDLGILEEDDEFEEFETEDWAQGVEVEAENLWEDNWDDDNIEDDFTIQLRFLFINLFQFFSVRTAIKFFLS